MKSSAWTGDFIRKEVFVFLQDKGIPHIVPVKKHSVEMKTLLKEKKARFARYTMKDKSKPLEIDIAIDSSVSVGKDEEVWEC